MAVSELNTIGINLASGGFEVNASEPQPDSWSLGCDITIEDADATLHEIRVGDISIAGTVSNGEFSVNIGEEESNQMNLDVNVVVDGINSSLVEAQIVPYDKILGITDISVESTSETKYASSARSAKIIYDLIKAVDTRVDELKSQGSNQSDSLDAIIDRLVAIEKISSLFHIDSEGNIYTEENFYSTQQISSGGAANTGSGGGSDEPSGEGYIILEDWAKYDSSLIQVLSATLGVELYNRIVAIENGSVTPDLSQYATITYVNDAIRNLINGAPEAYDTLKEIADVLEGNVNSIADILTAISTKANQSDLNALSDTVTEIGNELSTKANQSDLETLNENVAELSSELEAADSAIWERISELEVITNLFHVDENDNVYTERNLYSTMQISSGGIGEEGTGGTSGFVILGEWSNYDESASQALGANLGVELNERLTLLEGGSNLDGYATESYVDSKIASVSETIANNTSAIEALQEVDVDHNKRLESIESWFTLSEDGETLITEKNLASTQQVSSGGVGEEGSGGGTSGFITDYEMSDTSENPVANRIIKSYVDDSIDALGEDIKSSPSSYVKIKTVNGLSLYGEGNITIEGGGDDEGSSNLNAINVNGESYQLVDGIVTLPDYPSKVSDLSDTTISNQQNGDIIVWQESTEKWVNKRGMYHHVQSTPLRVWEIQHNMGKFPNVKIVDSSKQLCMADVYYVDENNVKIEFGSTQSGSAYLD